MYVLGCIGAGLSHIQAACRAGSSLMLSHLHVKTGQGFLRAAKNYEIAERKKISAHARDACAVVQCAAIDAAAVSSAVGFE